MESMKNFWALQTRAAVDQESFVQYVRRLLTDKSLSITDVELRAGGEISYSHIASILTGNYDNLRWETLKALARGLGVAEERLFRVAIGSTIEDFQACDFALFYRKFEDLLKEDKQESTLLLDLLHREIERMRQRIKAADSPPFKAFTDQFALRPAVKKESLREYVCRNLKEKRLTFKEVEKRSQQTISAAYIGTILNNGASNLTIEKIKGLARGLGVEACEIFIILRGHCASQDPRFKQSLFAALYHKYHALSVEARRELRLVIELIDREIDKRQMRKLRLAIHHELETTGCPPVRSDHHSPAEPVICHKTNLGSSIQLRKA
jgi:transcriptional regulator with XRE-family HTH domain